MSLFVGVMSGTSMDAVDAALVDLGASGPRLVATHRMRWPAELRQRLQAAASGDRLTADAFAALDADTGQLFADAVVVLLRTHAIDPARVAAIGCHGQTVTHRPTAQPATTLQLGDANVIAEQTGITTVNDFRRRDMAAGGQGAPLAPAFHAAVLRSPDEDRVVLNLGGIANITVLPADHDLAVTGFDTGPANCLLDLWTQRHTNRPYDAGGEWAASAAPEPGLLGRLLADPYFALAPPKSTGTQYFSAHWLDSRLDPAGALPAAQVQATLSLLTAQSATDAIRRHAPGTRRVLVCGGGVHNRQLMETLRSLLHLQVESTASLGIDPEWMEAMAFAWLAKQALAGASGNLPAVTGARAQRVLGAIHPG